MAVSIVHEKVPQSGGTDVTASIVKSGGLQQAYSWPTTNWKLQPANFTIQASQPASLSETTALASEDALGKIWNRPAEDEAWRNL
jgi:hypothetical protein